MLPSFERRRGDHRCAADVDSTQQVDISYPFEIAQFGSFIGFLAAATFVGIVGAVLVRRGRKQDHTSQEEHIGSHREKMLKQVRFILRGASRKVV